MGFFFCAYMSNYERSTGDFLVGKKIRFWIIILTELEIKHAMFVSEAPEVETIILHDYIKGMPL